MEFSFLSDQSPALQEIHIPPTERQVRSSGEEKETMRENEGCAKERKKKERKRGN